jgi:hypothetical protein
MGSNRYAAAGWAAILSAVATLAWLGLSFVFDVAKIAGGGRGFPPPPWTTDQATLVATIDACGTILGIYALVRFRDLLRERYSFHAVDHLIWIVIGAGLLASIVAHAQNFAGISTFGGAFAAMLAMAVVAILNGVIGLVFATRLLKVNGNLNGYKKPLAYVYLAASVCFILVVPSLFAVVLLAAWSILLGLAFFRGEEMEELEVV